MSRLFFIHQALSARRYPNCQKLAAELEINAKTVQRDISHMRDQMGLPIGYDEGRHGFYYTKSVKDFPLLQLSRKDLLALFLAEKALEPMKGTRLGLDLEESFRRIAEACPGQVSFRWQELSQAFSVQATGVVDTDFPLFGKLVDAVMDNLEIHFLYAKPDEPQPRLRKVHPYHVGQIDQGWYLIGHDLERQAIRTFSLPRISALTLTANHFARPADFDVKAHLRGGFGVWTESDSPENRRQVRIEFRDYAARAVAERHWHPTQQIIRLDKSGNHIEFRVHLQRLEDISRWVLSWGSKATVIEPQALRALVINEATQLLNAYVS